MSSTTRVANVIIVSMRLSRENYHTIENMIRTTTIAMNSRDSHIPQDAFVLTEILDRYKEYYE
ncbi:MAG: hypothetical protein ACTSXJ_10705 [Candidatus Baldrarchaeia archaeon]|mgnify:CR=1 FL=1